jgi:hypothetical protein
MDGSGERIAVRLDVRFAPKRKLDSLTRFIPPKGIKMSRQCDLFLRGMAFYRS